MFQSLTKILKSLEHYLNTDEFGLRNVVLKTFSTLIDHCRTTSVVDAQIKKTRKGLQSISYDYIQGILQVILQQVDVPMADDEDRRPVNAPPTAHG